MRKAFAGPRKSESRIPKASSTAASSSAAQFGHSVMWRRADMRSSAVLTGCTRTLRAVEQSTVTQLARLGIADREIRVLVQVVTEQFQ